jgi:hypothetical protein
MRGIGLSAGVRGASVSIGSRGAHANVGIPGTGLSYREKIGGGSEQRRTNRTQQRIERESQRLEKAKIREEALSNVKLQLDKESGSIQIEDSFGEALSQKDMKLVWDQKGDLISDWLTQQVDKINEDIELLTLIHEDTPSPELEPEYSISLFPNPPPEEPQQPEELPRPETKVLAPLGFFAKLFKSKRIEHEEKRKKLSNDRKEAMTLWKDENRKRHEIYQTAFESYRQAMEKWEKRRTVYDLVEVEKKVKFSSLIRTSLDVMNSTLEEAFNSLSWPRETIVSYQIMEDTHDVWIDIDFPEIEDFPKKVASIAANGKKLNIKDKSAKQIQLEYALHIHGIVFRVAGTVFATLPAAKWVTISGFSQRIDRATGKVSDEYLLSACIERDLYSKINFSSLDKVNPIDALGVFEIRRNITSTGLIRAIEPFKP